jgi:hypothetical protein
VAITSSPKPRALTGRDDPGCDERLFHRRICHELALWVPDSQHRARCGAHDTFGDTAEQHVAEGSAAARRADHDQIHAVPGGVTHDLHVRRTHLRLDNRL